MNVLARCANEKRYLQANVQATGNYVAVAVSVVRGSTLAPASVTLKRGRLDQLPPHVVLDMNQVRDVVSLRGLVPGRPIQLSMLCRAWWIKAGQRVLVIANGDGSRVNAESKALNNVAIAQSIRVRMISGQVMSGVVGSDGSTPINL